MMALTNLSPDELEARQELAASAESIESLAPVARCRQVMSLERQARIANGLMVLGGSVLAAFAHPNWLIWPAFMGASLIFSGIANLCGFAVILARLPWNHVAPPTE